jgi:glycine/D-amino acid oxidase-like deaminating enzyme
MPERSEFEVIIIGGGIAGASLAYFLTERGVTDVALGAREPAQSRHCARIVSHSR